MRKILSEKNIAALLFILVIVAFSFAHEDSKKRSSHYSVSAEKDMPARSKSTIIVSHADELGETKSVTEHQ